MRRKCGGFAAKECGDDERYYAEGLRPPKKGQRSKQPPQPQAEPQPAAGGGTDMRAVFAKLTKQGCAACIGAGYGWCPIKNICGGFANRECGGGGGGGGGGGAARAPRNGLWGGSRAEREAQAEAEAEPEVVAVDAPAASPQPAAVLHAGPASPSPPPPEATRPVAVEVGSAGGQRTAPASLSRAELHALSKSALVERVIELQRELGAWNEL